MMFKKILLTCAAVIVLPSSTVWAFCGFYVAKADTKIFNQASKVVLVRDENRTIMTMVNDFHGEAKEFAIVVPIPAFLEKEQIHVGDQAVVEHLDAYSAPRLVEYFDQDPCYRYDIEDKMMMESVKPAAKGVMQRARNLGVTIEASYTVGEYDILILSAKQSTGLVKWLQENNYKIPKGASSIMASYLKQNMRFFVAKVNLKEHAKLGFQYLRPLQIAYEHARFMLPIRLGTLNANKSQELFVFALTRKGRVESTNYRTIKLPTDVDVPEYIKTEFPHFYTDMFTRQASREGNSVVFLEYAWDMNWCDPCAADPLTDHELKQLGVYWIGETDKSSAKNIYVTRLHVRYTAASFPEDLQFHVTGNRENFQGRYIIRHPWKGDPQQCAAAKKYYEGLTQRLEKNAEQLANLTDWDINTIRSHIDQLKNQPSSTGRDNPGVWWKHLWN